VVPTDHHGKSTLPHYLCHRLRQLVEVPHRVGRHHYDVAAVRYGAPPKKLVCSVVVEVASSARWAPYESMYEYVLGASRTASGPNRAPGPPVPWSKGLPREATWASSASRFVHKRDLKKVARLSPGERRGRVSGLGVLVSRIRSCREVTVLRRRIDALRRGTICMFNISRRTCKKLTAFPNRAGICYTPLGKFSISGSALSLDAASM